MSQGQSQGLSINGKSLLTQVHKNTGFFGLYDT